MHGIPAIHASSVKRIKTISPLGRCIRNERSPTRVTPSGEGALLQFQSR